MPSSITIPTIILTTLVAVLFSYAAYWAFTIRRVLVAQLYRRQALWAGGMGAFFAALYTFVTLTFDSNPGDLWVKIIGGAFVSIGFIVIFFWLDSTIRVAQRSDPLLRDTLHWSKLRYFVGLITVGATISALATLIYSDMPFLPPIGGSLFLGGAALLVSAKRSGDPTFRKHLKWLGLAITLLFFGGELWTPVSKLNSDLVPAVPYAGFAIAAYCLYRSARSLVPLGRLSLTDSVVPTGSTRVSSFPQQLPLLISHASHAFSSRLLDASDPVGPDDPPLIFR